MTFTIPVESTSFILGILLVGMGFLGIIVLLLMLVYKAGKRTGSLEASVQHAQEIEEAREDAVKRSRSVLGGQIAEQVAPFLRDFPCKAEDCPFLRKPVDYIVFSGLYNNDTVNEIVFVEVKTGSSALSKREKSLKDAVEQKRVRYVEYRI